MSKINENIWRISVIFLFLFSSPACSSAATNERTVSKTFEVEPPTLISLGFEWYIEGDDNLNASVAVSYRKKGAGDWKQGLPLFRVHLEKGDTGSFHYVAPNMFAGSIFDLEPDTEYECRFVLSDPDGINGPKAKQVTVRTRPEPQPASGGHVYHVYPTDWKGPKEEPNFYSLYDAYFDNGGRVIVGDWYDVFPPRVQPGDTILMHAGTYKDDRLHYAHEERTPQQYGVPGFVGGAADGNNKCCGTTWDGTYYLTTSGTADKPIVIKGAGDGEVIFDGDGNHTIFNLLAANYTYVEGITFRNTEIGIEAGLKNIAGSTGLTVKHCRFEQVGAGIHADWSGAKNFYIADNVFIGKNDPDKVLPWFIKPPFLNMGLTAPPGLSRLAIRIYGSGHVIAFNQVRNFHDGIDVSTYGTPDGYPNTIRDRLPVSNDIYNNDISNVHDDCMEADGVSYNVRIMRNRCVNFTGSAFRFNTFWGGPAYLIRNIAYHAPANFWAILIGGSSGIAAYNNTFVAAVRPGAGANLHFANNLILAEDPADPAFEMNTVTNTSTSDYNGFMPGAKAKTAFGWQAPAPGTEADYQGKRENRRFKTLSEYSQATGQDKHSIMVDYAVFQDLHPVDVSAPTRLYDPTILHFALKPDSPAVDAGEIIPNITDGFTGKAPDLGALEVGQPVPHYGPRP